MRAIIFTRCLGIRYEGEVDPFDTLDDFLHETVLPGKGGDTDDDDDENMEGGPSGRPRGRRSASAALGKATGNTSGKTATSRFTLEVKAPPKLVVNKHASTRSLMRFASSVAGDVGAAGGGSERDA